MGIMPKFKQLEVQQELQKGYRTIENGILRILQGAGEQFVTEARDALNLNSSAFPKGNYQNQTINLRSSVGYFVLKDGVIIYSGIDGTAEGIAAGRAMLGKIPNKTGYQLIGVAGMDYASNVESKGYNVITSQKDVALINIDKMLGKFKENLNKKGVSVDFDMNDIILTATR